MKMLGPKDVWKDGQAGHRSHIPLAEAVQSKQIHSVGSEDNGRETEESKRERHTVYISNLERGEGTNMVEGK